MSTLHGRWAAAGVAALALAATAAASNSASYADPAGDGASAPDVAAVTVSNDDAGTIAFQVGIANRATLGPQDWVAVALDTDLKEDAEGFVEPEYLLSYGPGGAALERRVGEDWIGLVAPLLTSFGGSFQAGVARLTVNQTDIDDPAALNFWIVGGTDADESRDLAPDGDDVWDYRVLSPTLYVLRFDRPQVAAAGKRVVALMKVRGVAAGKARITCAATVGGKRVAGKADWFRIIGAGRTTAEPRCTWIVPRRTKGKLLRATMTVGQSGLQVGRSFSLRIR